MEKHGLLRPFVMPYAYTSVPLTSPVSENRNSDYRLFSEEWFHLHKLIESNMGKM